MAQKNASIAANYAQKSATSKDYLTVQKGEDHARL